MFLTRLLRQYRSSVRQRLGDDPDQTYVFEALLLLVLLGLLAVGIAWM